MLVAAHSSSIADVTARMVHIGSRVCPRNSFDVYAEQYRTLIRELASRGWLPQDLEKATLARVGL